MQCPCEQFLTGAAFTQEQGRDIGRRHFFDHAADGKHALARSDNPVQRRLVDLALQAAVFGLELVNGKRPVDDQSHDVGVNRFLVKVVCALRYGR